MGNDFNNKIFVNSCALLTAGICVLLACIGRSGWIPGVIVGAVWSTINIIFTIRIFRAIILREARKRIMVFLLIKFPLLYIGGALLLVYRVVSIGGFLVGLGVIFPALGVAFLWKSKLSHNRSL